jgi:nucleotide-binding universal stress UspA family protein
MEKLAKDYLAQITARIQDKGFPIKIVTVFGRPHKEIIRFAETEQVDIIVMCTRGYSGMSRWLMGSIADRVSRRTNIPVMLIRARKDSNGSN